MIDELACARYVGMINLNLTELLSQRQKENLARTQQLSNELEQRLTMRDVLGDQTERENLPELVAHWRAIGDNQKAEELAGIGRGTSSYA